MDSILRDAKELRAARPQPCCAHPQAGIEYTHVVGSGACSSTLAPPAFRETARRGRSARGGVQSHDLRSGFPSLDGSGQQPPPELHRLDLFGPPA